MSMQVRIEKIVPEGKSLAHLEDGKVVFIWGGLPGELIEINIIKNKKNFAEGEIVEIIEGSPDRVKPAENHYLICSPWQVLPYKKQIELKRQLLLEAYTSTLRHPSEGWDPEKNSQKLDSRLRGNDEVGCGEIFKIDKFYESEEKFGYRTKMEFSFTADTDGKIALAFHKRGANNAYEIIDGCRLGSTEVNKAAAKITEILNTLPGVGPKGLKSLTLRESKTTGQIIAVLLYKFQEYEINIKLDDLDGLVDGLIIGYSTIKSPISVITELKYQEGIDHLEESILGLRIQYPHDGFFQNNIPVFEDALNEIISATPESNKILELYSGVGTIGLALTKKSKEVSGLEIVDSAVEYSEINKKINKINKINNYTAVTLPDHKISAEIFEGVDVLVLDPPRSGLHPKTTAKIIEAQPKTIIYLSCNPVTQARDYANLKEFYKLKRLVGFDFYPNTLHMESLVVLERLK